MLTSCIACVNFNQHHVFKSDLKFTCTDPEGVGAWGPDPPEQSQKYRFLKPLSHWTATVLRQLATDIASGSQSSLETVASDSQFPRMCRQVAQSSRENFEHVQKFYATKFLAKWSQSHRGCLEAVANLSPTPRNLVAIIFEQDIFAR